MKMEGQDQGKKTSQEMSESQILQKLISNFGNDTEKVKQFLKTQLPTFADPKQRAKIKKIILDFDSVTNPYPMVSTKGDTFAWAKTPTEPLDYLKKARESENAAKEDSLKFRGLELGQEKTRAEIDKMNRDLKNEWTGTRLDSLKYLQAQATLNKTRQTPKSERTTPKDLFDNELYTLAGKKNRTPDESARLDGMIQTLKSMRASGKVTDEYDELLGDLIKGEGDLAKTKPDEFGGYTKEPILQGEPRNLLEQEQASRADSLFFMQQARGIGRDVTSSKLKRRFKAASAEIAPIVKAVKEGTYFKQDKEAIADDIKQILKNHNLPSSTYTKIINHLNAPATSE
jgi:hypothetical protein